MTAQRWAVDVFNAGVVQSVERRLSKPKAGVRCLPLALMEVIMEYITLPYQEFAGWLVMIAVMSWFMTHEAEEMKKEKEEEDD